MREKIDAGRRALLHAFVDEVKANPRVEPKVFLATTYVDELLRENAYLRRQLAQAKEKAEAQVERLRGRYDHMVQLSKQEWALIEHRLNEAERLREVVALQGVVIDAYGEALDVLGDMPASLDDVLGIDLYEKLTNALEALAAKEDER